MKRSALMVCATLLLSAQSLLAATLADSVLQFTGATRAKFVWLRNTWTNAAYQPTSPTSWKSTKAALVVYDTKDNTVKNITEPVEAVSFLGGGRIDRSGTWVVYPDQLGKRCMIRDAAAALPARVLIPAGNTMWAAICFGYEAAAGKQYLYCEDNYDTTCWCSSNSKVYKIPFDPIAGTVDLANKIDVGFKPGGDAKNLGISTVSADGRYIACSFPWPNDQIFDTQTKTISYHHNASSQFGCQPHIAPDNSYRFFHCMDDHEGIWFFPDFNSQADYGIYMTQAPNVLCGGATETSFDSPNWTNNVQFLSNTYPSSEGAYGEDLNGMSPDILSGADANWVKTQMQMIYKPSVFIQKFSADFKSIVASMYIAPDLRCFDKYLDSWLNTGEIDPRGAVAIRSSAGRHSANGLQLVQTGLSLRIQTAESGRTAVRITDSRGKVVRQTAGTGMLMVDTRDLVTGVYTISAVCGENRMSQPLVVSR